MTYIINPAWFYWINVLNNIDGLLYLICALILIVLILLGITFFIYMQDDDTEEFLKEITEPVKPLLIALSIIYVITIFIPDKTTCYQMMIAQYATKENLQSAATDTKDFIVDIAKEIQESAKKISGEKK